MPIAENYKRPFDSHLDQALAQLVDAENALLAALASEREDGQPSSIMGNRALGKLRATRIVDRVSDLVMLAELGARLARQNKLNSLLPSSRAHSPIGRCPKVAVPFSSDEGGQGDERDHKERSGCRRSGSRSERSRGGQAGRS